MKRTHCLIEWLVHSLNRRSQSAIQKTLQSHLALPFCALSEKLTTLDSTIRNTTSIIDTDFNAARLVPCLLFPAPPKRQLACGTIARRTSIQVEPKPNCVVTSV